MTVSIKISVNGNYKLPVKYKQGEVEKEIVLTGRGKVGPHEENVHFVHGAEAMTLVVGPEERDDGSGEKSAQ
jgi:hypothetical protein